MQEVLGFIEGPIRSYGALGLLRLSENQGKAQLEGLCAWGYEIKMETFPTLPGDGVLGSESIHLEMHQVVRSPAFLLWCARIITRNREGVGRFLVHAESRGLRILISVDLGRDDCAIRHASAMQSGDSPDAHWQGGRPRYCGRFSDPDRVDWWGL